MSATRTTSDDRNDDGFTLIELLVVVVIIGILIAIAIPLYLNYQKGAKNKSAASDTRNAIAVIEQCLVDNNIYPTAATPSTGNSWDLTGCPSGKLNYSPGNTLTYTPAGSPVTTYTVKTQAGAPGTKSYIYDSASGQITES